MIVRIFRSGISKGESPVNYLLSDTDHTGKKRSVQPEVLQGDPDTTISVINSIQRKHKYISGCLSFRNSEQPSKEQLHEIIDNFKSTFCPGLTPDHFNSLFVLHQDKGNTEVHFVIPTQELKTGRRMNIHPPGKANIQFFEAYTKVTNQKLGYAQVVPDPLKMAFSEFELKTPAGRKDQSDKRWIHKHLVKAVGEGKIKTRNDLCRHLDEELGITVTRQGSDYLAVKFPGAKKAKRLRGALYEEGADYTKLLSQSKAAKQPTYLSQTKFETEKARLNSFIQDRKQFNEQAYLTPRPLRRMAKPRPIKKQSVSYTANSTTRTTRSSPMNQTTIRLPVIRQMIWEALDRAREKIVTPEKPHQLPIAPQIKQKKETLNNISAIRDKSFGRQQPLPVDGLTDLNLSIIELEQSLQEAIGSLESARSAKHAEQIRQRIIQLQLQLDKLNAQKLTADAVMTESEIQNRKLSW